MPSLGPAPIALRRNQKTRLLSLCLTPRSSVPGVSWPAVPTGIAAQLLALQQQLAQSEHWPPERIAGHQFHQLSRLMAHAHDKIPFYRARLDALGYRRGQEITRAFWTTVPVLGRREVQAQGSALVCRDLPAEHGTILSNATSGSTGMPLQIITTELAQTFWRAVTLRQQIWQGRDLRLKFASIRRDHENRA